MEKIKVRFKALDGALDLPAPSYSTQHSAGMDLRAAVQEETVIEPGEIALIPLGFQIELPHGFEAQVRPRGGLALNHGITVLNTPGTVDSDYRGEVKVILINLGKKPFAVKRGDRIAQLVIQRVVQAELEQASELSETARGEGGFGSTGK